MKDPKKLERYQRWKAVFGEPAGQSVLADLKKMAGQDSVSLVQSNVDGKIDPYGTMYREGRRSIWLDISEYLKEPPDIPEEGDDGDELSGSI